MPLPPLIPLEHFFDNPERAGARIAPDGSWLSWLAPRDGVLNIWVADRSGENPVPVTNDRGRGIRSYFWSRDSKRLLYVQDAGGDENYHLFALDPLRPDRVRDLTPFPGRKAGVIAVPRSTPRQVLVSLNLRQPHLFDAYRLTLSTGRLELVRENPGSVQGWQADREGRIRAAFAQTPEGDHELLVSDSEVEPMRVLARFDNEDEGHPFAFRSDGDALYIESARGCDRSQLVEIDIATGAETVIHGDEVADLGGPILSGRTGALLGVYCRRDRAVVTCFDDDFARDWGALAQIHSGDPAIVSETADESTWIVTFDDDRDPGATYLVERGGEARLLHRPRPWLPTEDLAPMTPAVITSRDGLPLRSYLTLPVGIPAEGLPAVLVVHGGPWSRDAWGYDAQAQFLANRGYAVLQINYRGSSGFGKGFMHAAEGEFAGKMHDDLLDGVEWLVSEGIADRERIGIFGGSYGGYATLVGVTFTPDVFAAACSYVGPSSLVTLIRSFPDYWRPFLKGSWYRYVGDPDDPKQLADLEARSPLNRVDAITTPLLVVQGANDPRVTKVESDQIVAALRERNVEVEYMVKDDEGHGFIRPENRLDLYRALERFLATHLGGRTGADT